MQQQQALLHDDNDDKYIQYCKSVKLMVSSLIIAGSGKTVEFFSAINFNFVSNVQRLFPWISILSSLEDASKQQNLDIYKNEILASKLTILRSCSLLSYPASIGPSIFLDLSRKIEGPLLAGYCLLEFEAIFRLTCN